MHEKVKQFIEGQEQEKIRRREQHLIRLGLVEREYSEDWHRDYPHWDAVAQKHYKTVPINVTDEEYAAISSYVKEDEMQPKRNSVASALKVLAWVILAGGFLAGLIFASQYNYGFDWEIAIGYWAFPLLSGMIFLALAEIIALLQALANKMD